MAKDVDPKWRQQPDSGIGGPMWRDAMRKARRAKRKGVVHAVTAAGVACGRVVQADEAVSYKPHLVTCTDCRRRETMSVADILSSWAKTQPSKPHQPLR